MYVNKDRLREWRIGYTVKVSIRRSIRLGHLKSNRSKRSCITVPPPDPDPNPPLSPPPHANQNQKPRPKSFHFPLEPVTITPLNEDIVMVTRDARRIRAVQFAAAN